mgnify:FL=1
MDKIQRTRPKNKAKSGLTKLLKALFIILFCLILVILGYLFADIIDNVVNYIG